MRRCLWELKTEGDLRLLPEDEEEIARLIREGHKRGEIIGVQHG